jgi:NhaA family Na+:H+ antiporter
MPLFALANAGIVIGSDFFTTLINPVSIGVIAGLILGKFIGVLLFTWLMIKTGLGILPEGATWKHIAGVAALAGIGFTMSLFVSALAFEQQVMVDEAKYGILIASVIAASTGYVILKGTTASSVSADTTVL